MLNVVVCVIVAYIYLIFEVNSIVISNSTPKSYIVTFITQNHGNLNRNKFKSNYSLRTEDKRDKRINNNLSKLFGNLSDRLTIDHADYFQEEEEDSTKVLLGEICEPEEAAEIRSELLTALAENLSICNLTNLASQVNQKIASGQNLNLTGVFSKLIISLANARKTRELLLLIEHLIKHCKVLDLFHLSLAVRYFAQMSYCGIDAWQRLFSSFASLDFKTKYSVFVATDGLKPLALGNTFLDKSLHEKTSLDKSNSLEKNSLENSNSLEKSSDKTNCEINSLSLFGLDESYIFVRDQMRIGLIESFAMGLLQIINTPGEEELIGAVEADSGDECVRVGSNSKISSMINELNKISRSGRNGLSWISRVILRHLNRIMGIEEENVEKEGEKLYYGGDIITEFDSNDDVGEGGVDESYISTIDRIINSPLSQVAKQSVKVKVPLALPRFIYPSTHGEIFNELIKATSYGRVVDIANLLFSNVNVEEVAISDVYHVSKYMLKFKRATSVITTLLRFDVLNSNNLLEHIKCSTYECEVERDPIEALKVLNLFKQMGITHSQELIDDLAAKLNHNN